jgi:hypothetical protein
MLEGEKGMVYQSVRMIQGNRYELYELFLTTDGDKKENNSF